MKTFQPGPMCGNCLSFRKSAKDKNGKVLEPCDCGKGNDPETCEDFNPRNKRIKSKQRKQKYNGKRWK